MRTDRAVASLPAPDLDRIGRAEYAVPKPVGPIDLWLHGNEGPAPSNEAIAALAHLQPEFVRRYPDARPLEARLAEGFGVAADRVVVTAGADEAIDRFCRAFLGPDRNVVVLTPAFEMVERYVRLAGAALREVPWENEDFPTDAVLGAIDAGTVAIVFATPSNPTGLVAPSAAIETLAARAPNVWLLLDLVYAEFLSSDPTRCCLGLQNAVVLRSFSKSGGLAGARVGFAIGPAPAITAMRRAGGPFSVAAPSLALAGAALAAPPEAFDEFKARVAEERVTLRAELEKCGVDTLPTEANFVLARTDRARWLFEGLASQGIAVRWFGQRAGLTDAVRITCPGDAVEFARLVAAIRVTLAPQALLFDMDGVLVDVRESYDRAIETTAASFGVTITDADIAAGKAAGNANNDWALTRRLLAQRGVEASLAEVTERFETVYLERLCQNERPTIDARRLHEIAARFPLGIVTGRPRRDAERFLDDHGLTGLFRVVVCMEDAPLKPAPDPVRAALRALDVERAWLFGDTVDDVRAARAAGVVPIGIVPPGGAIDATGDVLAGAGASRVLPSLDAALEELTTTIPT